ncbi:hypothetical protein [Priestia megaterium]|uniref:hypothetical protein n=1 Tax=Priestia megaterium TaxID=1404 RepID=UPI002877AB41|nr:hypothetical protein [Priestia megaterium]
MKINDNIIYYSSQCGKYTIPHDKETGKQIYNLPPQRVLQPYELIMSKDSIKSFKEKKKKDEEFENNKKKGFVHQGRGIQNPLGQLRHSTLHYLIKLYPLFRYDGDPILINGKKANSTALIEYLKLGTTAGSQLLNELVDKEVLKVIKGKGNTKYYGSTGKFVIKGQLKDKDSWTVKVFQEKLQEIINNVEKEIKNHPEKENIELYPLAVLAAVIPFFHFQTFFLCKNYDEDILKGQEEGILKVMKQSPTIIKHLPKITLWRLATGKVTKKMNQAQRRKLDIYFEILCKAGAINYWNGRKTLILINPDLVFVSNKIKDDSWYEAVTFLFEQANP